MDVFELFEGVCPTCGEEVEIVEIGVKPSARWETEGVGRSDAVVTLWSEEADYDIGYTFRCGKGHSHYAERSEETGEWLS